MSLFNPDDFVCTQGDCPLSCCCGWRIGLDEATEQRWQSAAVQQSDDWFAALDCVGEDEFKICLLAQDEEACCRLMDDDGLCIPHKAMGMEYKPDTCRRFPLIDIPDTDSQHSLSLACPEAARMLLLGDADTATTGWRSFSDLRAFANGLFVDWHESNSSAGSGLWVWLREQPISVAGLNTAELADSLPVALKTLNIADRDTLQRYLIQCSLHLGLPNKPYYGDAIASVTQLTVLLLALLGLLASARGKGLSLSSAETGLLIARLERLWGHPSSGMALISEQAWLAQLDWREPVLSILVDALDV